MTNPIECIVCYEPIKNKVILECSHEVCLECIIKIIQIRPLSCPMCRKKYDIYLSKEKEEEEQVFEVPNEYVINLFPQNEHDLRSLIINDHLGNQCSFYEVFVHHGEILNQFSFIILHSAPIQVIEQLICNLVISSIPHGLSLQNLRQGTSKYGQYEMINTNHYLQDYFDILIQTVSN